MNRPLPAANRNLTLVGRLMLIEAATFAIASILHFGVGETFIAAAIPEAIIAVVLGAGAIAVMRRGSWWLGLATTLFALAGVVLGLTVIIGGPVLTRHRAPHRGAPIGAPVPAPALSPAAPLY